jgi:hypothetical protein
MKHLVEFAIFWELVGIDENRLIIFQFSIFAHVDYKNNINFTVLIRSNAHKVL